MLTKEILNDLNIYADMITPLPTSIQKETAVTYTGDMHGAVKHKLKLEDPALHPLMVYINGFTSTLEYSDEVVLKTIDTIGARPIDEFTIFIDSLY